jgi:DNA topoisomerase-3
MERAQRELVPTPKAESLLQFLTAVKADALTKPDMTGEWEYKLRQMEHGKYPRDKFMAEIVEVVKGVVDRTKNFEEDDSAARTTDIISPTDGKPMLETLRGYKSQDGILMVYKVITGRKLEESEVKELVTKGEIGPLDGFVSPRTGNRFPSKLVLADDPKHEGKRRVDLDFGNKFDLATLNPFWTDPSSGAELCEAPTSYVLREKSGDTYEQKFSVGRLMCQKPITREIAIQLVSQPKTDLIVGFISKKGRPFDAFLTRVGPKFSWEFPPRKPRVGKDGKTVERKAKVPVDFSKAQTLITSKFHDDGTLMLTPEAFYVTKPQADGSLRVVFEVKRVLCGKELPVEEIERLVTDGRTGLIEELVSKRGSHFSAYLVLSKDKKKAEFEFPPR